MPHTPGPWTTSRASFTVAIRDADYCIIGEVYGMARREEREVLDNARLIAAAPDLLAMCKRMDSFLESIGGESYGASAQTLHADILCAIAKAEVRPT